MKTYILTVVSIMIFSSFGFGASFIVNNNGDTNDVNLADNLCADSAGNCTLRAAVQQANSSASDDVITFAAGLQTITLALGTEIPINNVGTLQINGLGANVLTINGGTGSNRIFNTNAATVTIADVTLTDGGLRDFVSDGGMSRNGGAILANGGSLTIQRVHLQGNTAGSTSTIGNPGSGGAIDFVGGTHLIENSTFSNNYANGPGGGVSIESGTVTIVNSTFSENTGRYQGGGLYNSGSLTLRNTTIANNFCAKASGIFNIGYGGGIANSNGTLEINNTIVAGNTAQNTTMNQPSVPEIYFNGGTITSTGNNFIGDSAGDSTSTGNLIAYQPTDIRDIPPQLAPLGNYGGTTPTRALLANSPAINAGNNTNAPPTDQRGAPRVGAVDIGAYEFGGLLFSISGRVTSDGTNGLSGVTVTLSGSSSATTTTNANGEYSFTGLVEGGNYTVTPSLAGTIFSPLNATFNNLVGNQTANFSPQCNYTISPVSATISATGGTGTVMVTTSNAGCTWTAASNVAWITITGGAMGTGNGTVSYTVAANSGPVRTGTLTIAGQTFTVTQSALPTLSINNISLFEGNSGTTAFTFTVTISGDLSQTVTVNYATVNGTATPPTDYQATSGTLSFAPGDTSKTITILVNGDTTVELNENFTVTLSGASNATITTAQGTGTIRNDDGAGARTKFDYDGDGQADLAVFRPSNGVWYVLSSQSNLFVGTQFGSSGDKIAPADYDGDGKTDLAVFRENIAAASTGAFYILNSADNSFRPAAFGSTGDVPVSGDWDGDGIGDLAVYRDGSLTGGASLFIYRPSSAPGVDFRVISWGAAGDKPVVGDYDGDGKLDAAIFRPSIAQWYILRSSNNQFFNVQFGNATDVLTPADYTGDGVTDVGVFRPSNGTWYYSSSQTNPSTNFVGVQFGVSGDLPVPADYDGDGKADVAVFRPSNGIWYLQRSTAGFTGVQFGANGDKPSENAYVR